MHVEKKFLCASDPDAQIKANKTNQKIKQTVNPWALNTASSLMPDLWSGICVSVNSSS